MKIIQYFFILALLFISFTARGDNYSFLDDTAGQYFTEQDWTLYLKTQQKALNNHKDGVRVSWRNPASGSSGYFIPAHTARKQGLFCRDLTIVNHANYRTGKTTLTFCKDKGVWKGV